MLFFFPGQPRQPAGATDRRRPDQALATGDSHRREDRGEIVPVTLASTSRRRWIAAEVSTLEKERRAGRRRASARGKNRDGKRSRRAYIYACGGEVCQVAIFAKFVCQTVGVLFSLFSQK